MKLWKQWSHKLDGWVERRRRFQKTGVESSLGLAEKTVPVAEAVTVPTSVPNPGKAPDGPRVTGS
jgi:hypothetical protein